uniref:SPX domain-containing protein n=1 Tax=Macrostomum lignano TaxID=282301 RepID=A0A1I8F8G5_9PLAT
MKFAEHLQAHLTPEWRTQYIDYDMSTSAPCLIKWRKDDKFYELCEEELQNKINDFFQRKVGRSQVFGNSSGYQWALLEMWNRPDFISAKM